MRSAISGAFSRAVPILVSGPRGHRVIDFNGACRIDLIIKSTACSDCICICGSGKVAPSKPVAPCTCSAVTNPRPMGWAQPANTLISGRPASSHTWSALWLVRARGTFPATQVMPNTLSSGEAKASRIATASSWPGSVSIMMSRLIRLPSVIIML